MKKLIKIAIEIAIAILFVMSLIKGVHNVLPPKVVGTKEVQLGTTPPTLWEIAEEATPEGGDTRYTVYLVEKMQAIPANKVLTPNSTLKIPVFER